MEENTLLLIINISIYILTGGTIMLLPRITRKNLLYGVKVPGHVASTVQVEALHRRFVIVIASGTILVIAASILLFLLAPQHTLLATLYTPILFIPLYFCAFYPNWRQAVVLKEANNWQVSGTVFAEISKPANTNNMPIAWYAASIITVAASFIVSVSYVTHMPYSSPADSFRTGMLYTSSSEVLVVSIINACVVLLIFLVAIIVNRVKLQVDPNQPALSFSQHKVYRKRMGHALGFLTLCTAIGFAIINILHIFRLSTFFIEASLFVISMLLFTAPVVVLIIVVIVTGQGGCKVKIHQIAGCDVKIEAPIALNRGDDKYWIMGLFYYNPSDPAHMVESRFGVNITPNYARVAVKIIMALVIITLVATYIWSTWTIFP